jgi:hypothetical protein
MVCITLPAQGRDYDEMAAVLAAVVRELGGSTSLARDGDQSSLQADVVILLGKCSAFDASPRLLARRPSRRPATVLWHVEPLPPAVIPEGAERMAERLASCDLNRLPPPLPAMVRCVPGHGLMVREARRVLCSRLLRRCNWNVATGPPVHVRQWYHAVQHGVWLKQRYSSDWCDFVAAGTPARCQVLGQMGIANEYAPLGYHRLWGTNQGRDRDIDVVFLGRVKRTGRQPLLLRIKRQLTAVGVRLVVVEGGCHGEARTDLLNRSRISLDLGQNTWEMPVLRTMVSMACGALVVSNCTLDPYPFCREHLVLTDADSLARVVLEALHNEPARREKTQAAYHYVTTALAWHAVVSRVLQRARSQRATSQGVTP